MADLKKSKEKNYLKVFQQVQRESMITQEHKLWKRIKKGYAKFFVEKTTKEMINAVWLPQKVIDGDTNSNIYKFLTLKFDKDTGFSTCNINEVTRWIKSDNDPK